MSDLWWAWRVALVLATHALANFVQDAFYFINHGSCFDGFRQLRLSVQCCAARRASNAHACVEVGHAFSSRGAGHPEKARAVNPIKSFASPAMHRASD